VTLFLGGLGLWAYYRLCSTSGSGSDPSPSAAAGDSALPAQALEDGDGAQGGAEFASIGSTQSSGAGLHATANHSSGATTSINSHAAEGGVMSAEETGVATAYHLLPARAMSDTTSPAPAPAPAPAESSAPLRVRRSSREQANVPPPPIAHSTPPGLKPITRPLSLAEPPLPPLALPSTSTSTSASTSVPSQQPFALPLHTAYTNLVAADLIQPAAEYVGDSKQYVQYVRSSAEGSSSKQQQKEEGSSEGRRSSVGISAEEGVNHSTATAHAEPMLLANISKSDLVGLVRMAEGHFSVAYKALWRRKPQPLPVVVKVAKKAGAAQLADMLAELQASGRLPPHSHVLAPVGFCVVDSNFWLVTPFCVGGSLESILRAPNKREAVGMYEMTDRL
jgi:hypothetical protein